MNRYQRELKAITTNKFIAVDHTMEAVKTYDKKQLKGAKTIFDIATETGETALAVLAPNARVKRVAHTVKEMARRPNFNPVAMHTNVWPHREAFWKLILGEQLQDRLRLFHFMQRTVRTMRQGCWKQ